MTAQILIAFTGVHLCTAQISVVPLPAFIETMPGSFNLTAATRIVVPPGDEELRAIGEYLAAHVDRAIAVEPIACVSPHQGEILLTRSTPDNDLGDEGYELVVLANSVTLQGAPHGLFLGVQTIRQLLDAQAKPQAQPAQLPCVRIRDKPRFGWRGMLLDCGRHFMSVEFVKRYVDLLAYHKMNVLHWHLTEDQGWRIQIERYPQLTAVGAWRGTGQERYGGFYSKADIREIVAYARSRYVTVVPEIEMPGHSMAALACYPQLSCNGGPFEVGTRWGVYDDVYCAGNDEVFTFLENVLAEVIELFPAPFIHIGGDECPKIRWKTCGKCQARMKTEGLDNEDQLQSYFIRRIEQFLKVNGRHLIGWDEIVEGGLAPGATVQSWRGMTGAVQAAQAGHHVIASPTSHCYLDYPYSTTSLQTAYSFEPVPKELNAEEAALILGIEGNMWTERAPQDRVDHQVFPRLCALAEVAWSPRARRNWNDFQRRMCKHYGRLNALGVEYYFAPPSCASPDRVFTDSIAVVLEKPSGQGTMHYTLDGSMPTRQSPEYVAPLSLSRSTMVKARTFLPGGHASDVLSIMFDKQRPLPGVRVAKAAPGLQFEYYEGQWQQLPDFDQLTPVTTGHSATFDVGVRRRDDYFAVVFSGYLQVPTEGTYTFYVTSDDGSRLVIGQNVVVEHDGLHSASERWGQIILAEGFHPIRVEMFEAGGAQNLQLRYKGPGISKQVIPPPVLSHSQVRNNPKVVEQ